MADREDALTRSRRELLLTAAFAIWGLAIAISLASVWDKPAPPGQLPGFATRFNFDAHGPMRWMLGMIVHRFNFDAHGPMRWMLGMIVLPLLLPLISRPLIRRLVDAPLFHAALIAPLVTLWFVTITRVPGWAIVPCAIVLAICAFVRRDMGFTRRDIVLVPVLLVVVLSLNDITQLSIDRIFLVAALLVFALRVAVALIPTPLPPALAFVLAPLGLVLQTGFFARDQRYLGWHALAIAVITPFLLRFVLRNARRAVAILVFVTFPLSLAAYINATGQETAEGKPRVDVFEDAHPLLPASEYLGRELPYRDVIPTHGLLEDGVLDFLIFKVRGVSIGSALKTRGALEVLNIVALYALAWALTGSAEMAFLAVLLSLLTNSFTGAFRLLPAIVALALMCGAVRYRRLQWLRYAAIATVLAGATSLDFGAYAFITLLVAAFRFPAPRLQVVRAVLTGLAIAAVPLFGGFLVLGIFDDFFRTSFVELLSLGPIYTQSMFHPPDSLPRNFPEALVGFFARDAFLYLSWCGAVIFAAIFIARRPRRRIEPLLLTAVFMTVTAISYAERHHLYFTMAAVPFAMALVWLARRTPFVPAIVVALLILAAPTTHLGVVGWIRHLRGPAEPHWVEVPEIPRARGALFHEADATALRAMNKYASLALGPEETWLDFSNRGLFYFLLRRDCPIRQPEVAFYQTEARQREVINRLESDPRIRAVLLSGPSGRYTVDGVPNQERAPLVWQYIESHFAPDFEEGDVTVWRRK